MTADFSSIYNHHEREVFAAVLNASKDFPDIATSPDLLCDVACVALNRLPPRYIRHEVDFSFYLTEHERLEIDNAIKEAVGYAFNFVQARTALRSRI
ncbi:MAG: late competence development ComFB family protein [Roseateles sp.]